MIMSDHAALSVLTQAQGEAWAVRVDGEQRREKNVDG